MSRRVEGPRSHEGALIAPSADTLEALGFLLLDPVLLPDAAIMSIYRCEHLIEVDTSVLVGMSHFHPMSQEPSDAQLTGCRK